MPNFDEEKFIKTIVLTLNKTKGIIMMHEEKEEKLFEENEKVKPHELGIRYTFDDEDKCIIDLYLMVEFGTPIPQIAWEIQTSLKEVLSEMNIKVDKIHIHIEGVK